jgi:hypothetical protein
MCFHVRSTERRPSPETDGFGLLRTGCVAERLLEACKHTTDLVVGQFLRQHAYRTSASPTHSAPNWHPIYGCSCRRGATPRLQASTSLERHQARGIAAPVLEHCVASRGLQQIDGVRRSVGLSQLMAWTVQAFMGGLWGFCALNYATDLFEPRSAFTYAPFP